MKLIHLSMNKRGIRFFRKLKEYLSEDVLAFYEKYVKKGEFLHRLQTAKSSYDMVLISAHGSEGAIILPIKPNNPNQKFRAYINKDETTAFKNKFVFAVSCQTANEFGKASVDNGALSYLGYEVYIESIFQPDYPHISNRVAENFSIIFKRIFMKELSYCIGEFTRDICTVEKFRQLFTYRFDKSITELSEMDSDQIFEKFQVRIYNHHLRKYAPELFVNYLKDIEEIGRRLVIVGDPNFISDNFIKCWRGQGMSVHEIKRRLLASPAFGSIIAEDYKNYLISVLK